MVLLDSKFHVSNVYASSHTSFSLCSDPCRTNYYISNVNQCYARYRLLFRQL